MTTLVTDYTALLAEETERWNAQAGDGAPVVITYSFCEGQTAAQLEAIMRESVSAGSYVGLDGFASFDANQQTAFQAALAIFEATTGVVFIEVDDPADAMIRVMNSNPYSVNGVQTNIAGFANYPTISDNEIINYTEVSSNGAIVMTQGTGGDYSVGTPLFETLLHEIGHAMGLKHSFPETQEGDHNHESEIALDPSQDNTDYTVMSYTTGPGGTKDTLQVYDVEALQHIYGGTDGFDSVTISWDETLDVLTMTGSTSGDVLTAADVDSTLDGGAGDDTLIGRDGDDTFTPGAGDATVEGGTGLDTLVLAGNLSDYVLSRGGGLDGLVLTGNGGASVEGRVSIRSIDRIEFTAGNQTQTIQQVKDALLPDLVIGMGSSQLSNLGDLTAGQTTAIEVLYLNAGAVAASFDKDGVLTGPGVKVYLKQGTDFTNDGIEVGFARIASPVPGNSGVQTLSIDITVPDTVPAGSDYTLYFLIDGQEEVFESAENNLYSLSLAQQGIQILNANVQPEPTDLPVVTVTQYEAGDFLDMMEATLVNGEYGYINQFSMVYEAQDASGITAVLTGSGFTYGGSTGTVTGITFWRGNVMVLEATGYDQAQADWIAAINAAQADDFTLLEAIINGYEYDFTGSDEADSFLAGANDDTIDGSAGADTLGGGLPIDPEADPTVDAFNVDGDDSISAGDGDDVVVVGGGMDTLDGGNDTVDGDTLVINTSGLTDGAFTVDYDLSTGQGRVDGVLKDAISNFENIFVTGTAAIDATLTGDANANQLLGGLGADNLNGGAGDDTVLGGEGDDVLSGGDDDDIVLGQGGNDTINTGDGTDLVDGGDGNDFINVGAGGNNVRGGTGLDTFQVFEGGSTSFNDFNIFEDVLNLAPLGLTVAQIEGTLASDGQGGLSVGFVTGQSQALTSLYFTGLDAAAWDAMTIVGVDGTRAGGPRVATVTETSAAGSFDTLVLGALIPEALNVTVNPAATEVAILAANGNTVLLTGFGFEIDAQTGDPLGGMITGFEVQDAQATTLTSASGFYIELVAFSDALDAEREGNPDPLSTLFDRHALNITGSVESEDLTYLGTQDDTVAAGGGNDSIDGAEGDDSLNGEGGNDTIEGGSGNDTLTGGSGSDDFRFSHGDTGNTVITDFDTANDALALNGWTLADLGTDMLDEVTGTLRITLAPGTTILMQGLTLADAGDIFIIAADGDQTGFGATAITFTGDGTDEAIDGSELNDTLDGAGGNDTIDAGDGDDSVQGGAGDDLLILGGGADTMDGGTGIDTLRIDVGNAQPGAFTPTVDLAAGTVSAPELPALDDVISNIENVEFIGAVSVTLRGDEADNTLTTDSGNDTLIGGSGNDTLRGGDGRDLLDGGIGADRLDGGEGNDSLYGRDGANLLRGENGNDTLYGGSDGETMDGGNGEDSLFAGAGDDILRGGDGADQLRGGLDNDTLDGDSGNDVLYGHFGNDLLRGGADNDMLYGDIGQDTLEGGGGNDTLDGGDSSDFLDGGEGADSLLGGAGDDQLFGRNGADHLNGGIANDILDGAAGNDTLQGGDGDDRLSGGLDADNLSGDAGQDTLQGGQGDDTLNGGEGDDFLDGGDGADSMDGGDGADTLFGRNGADHLNGGIANDILDGAAGNDTLQGGDGDDRLSGGLDADNLSGDAGQDTLQGGQGDDTLNGGEGDDFLDGGDGADSMDGGDGADTLFGRNGENILNGQGGNDTIYGGDQNDTLNGGLANDSLFAGSGFDMLRGDAGSDTLSGGIGNDTLSGGADDDLLNGGQGSDSIDGDGGSDRLFGQAAMDRLNGGDGNDTLHGEDGNDTLYGDGDNDQLYGGTGQDELHGGTGNDTLSGGLDADNLSGDAGQDTLQGGQGDDTLNGGEGDDFLDGGDGADSMDGGDGADTLFGRNGENILNGQGGNDTIYGGDQNDSLSGGMEDDSLFAGGGADMLDGGAGVDQLSGGTGDDTLSGGDGNDLLTGASGADDFVFATGDDADTITDFDTSADELDVTGLGLAASQISGLTRTDTAGGLLIDFGNGDSVTLQGLTTANEDEIDFITTSGTYEGFDPFNV